MDVVISDLQADDRDHWELLYRAYADFYQVPMSQEIMDEVWSWIHDQQQSFYGKIAKDGSGEALGMMHFRAMPSPLRGSHVGFLDDLFVKPEFRGKGVVDALFEELDLTAKAHGWPFVRWITADDNYRGQAVYDKLAEKTKWLTYQMPIKHQG
ncbi:MAG: GNAT family N-acetyltransferase [Gammaproteobacteria bacterium]|nr:GNAT family N-acetyltransferase [Gammaproteobacteria bacterium]MBT3859344.1 GNAT family N-acetyltransferase [Gammaproteobacteria bacterium]MBT3986869.1 GNAT family N-acetyltransferase [Gammaproteobacteria bacterium]MBT4255804.1 GNAT family N-acetyltransferase [Gammaproteobacteria bacterium]MBT4581942.1 GNAT family N-acetyltransferase [Gammaproteobacteria bacterium]